MPDPRAMLGMWARLGLPLRVVMLVGLLAAVIAVPVVLTITRDRSTSLFAQALDPDQIAEVDARLAEWNVPHLTQIDAIRVEAVRRNELLLRLSLAGLPHAHIATSNEALAKLNALTPDALLAAQTRAGLAGDLALGLRGIDGITDASVVIAPSQPGAFGDQDGTQAGASVRLSLHPGAGLSAASIDGVRAYVANAVPGLSRDHITILDDHGVDLASTANQREDADGLRTQLQSALDDAFGSGSTIVRVRARYDDRTRTLHETDRVGVSGPAIASQGSDERLADTQKHYSKRESTVDRGSVVKEEQTVVPADTQARWSVAVFVDEGRGIDLVKVRGLVAEAAGLDRGAGDSIIVEPLRFARAAVAPTSPVANAVGPMLLMLPQMIALVVIVIGARFAVKPLGVALRHLLDRENVRATQRAVEGFAPRHVHGVLSGEPPHTAAAVISALPAATASVVLELYSSEERTAIISRMSRPPSAFLPPWETLLRGE